MKDVPLLMLAPMPALVIDGLAALEQLLVEQGCQITQGASIAAANAAYGAT